MRSLVLLVDGGAPSFCYYPSPTGPGARMAPEVLEAALAFAAERELAVQVIGAREGIAPELRERLEAVEHVCYVAAGAGELRPEDVPVLDAGQPDLAASLPAGRHPIAILRVPGGEVDRWPAVFAELGARVERVVLTLLDLGRWDEAELDRYQQALAAASEHLLARHLAGSFVELSAISDRLVLSEPAECGAGLDHLTVAPDGGLHVCPGFALDGDAPLGRVGEEPVIPNAQLLRRDHAPICDRCDAHHCRRCVHLNLCTTLEINTPPWQLCRAAHLEREAGRLLLARLQERGLLRALPTISTVPYEEPFEALTGHKMRARVEPRRFAYLELPSLRPNTVTDGETPKEKAMDQGKPVGRVTPEERDQIRELFLRKAALTELFLSLSKLDSASLESSPLYEKVVRDMGDVSQKFQTWWEQRAKAYGWEGRAGGSWNIDFDTCEIYLV